MTLQKVMHILCEIKETPELLPELTPESDIINDVGLDSLQMINFILAIEDEFDLEIDFETFNYEHLSAIQTFVAFLEGEGEKKAAS